jgi:hypothetical protein
MSPAPTWLSVLTGTFVTSRAICAGAGVEPSVRRAASATLTGNTESATKTTTNRRTAQTYCGIRHDANRALGSARARHPRQMRAPLACSISRSNRRISQAPGTHAAGAGRKTRRGAASYKGRARYVMNPSSTNSLRKALRRAGSRRRASLLARSSREPGHATVARPSKSPVARSRGRGPTAHRDRAHAPAGRMCLAS